MAAAVLVAAADAAFPGRNGGIVFASVGPSSSGSLWMINPDASGRTKIPLANRLLESFSVAWSPDGRRIAFVAAARAACSTCDPGSTDVHVAPAYRRAGQTTVRSVVVFKGIVQGAGGREDTKRVIPPRARIAWSPDGRRIVFQRGPGLRVVRSDGIGMATITGLPIGPYQDADPVWSPDGRRIAFAGGRFRLASDFLAYACASIFTARLDGKDIRHVTPGQPVRQTGDGPSCEGEYERAPAWSPDGTRLAFVRGRSLWVVRVADGAETKIAEPTKTDWNNPVWSPDGRKIAGTLGGGIWVMNPDGSGKRRVVIGVGNIDIASSIDWQRCASSSPCGVPRGSR